jgi:hypothetical protein
MIRILSWVCYEDWESKEAVWSESKVHVTWFSRHARLSFFCYHACNYTTTMAKKHMHAPTTPFRSTVVTRHRTIIRVVNAIDSALRKEKDWKPSRSRNTGMCVLLGFGFLFSRTSIKPTCTYPVLMFHATQQHVIKLPWLPSNSLDPAETTSKARPRTPRPVVAADVATTTCWGKRQECCMFPVFRNAGLAYVCHAVAQVRRIFP